MEPAARLPYLALARDSDPMTPHEILLYSFAFCLGACIGSFLNVCIYRMPRDLSVNEPKRSFCPSCKYQIPWHHNLPLISWLVLRGKCGNCGARISFRYFGVELLTALLFVGVWHWSYQRAWILALPLWIMVSLFVVATFIDFEHYIIPDEITWGGAVAGVLLSFAIPKLHGANLTPLQSGIQAVIGAAAGYFLLWGVVEAGKLAFGRKRIAFPKKESFTWTRHNDDADLVVGEEKSLWSEFFARPTDRLIMKCAVIEISGEHFENVDAVFHYDRVQIGQKTWELIKLDTITGEVTEIVIPREAMGFGDVKYMACIGAFLGWKAVLFTVVAASLIGAVVGILTIVIGKREWSTKIPFGPYLSVGALIWLFSGPWIVSVYWNLTHPVI
jgi:leader peptidase (prepilin peptidase)/N-methyltransferase